MRAMHRAVGMSVRSAIRRRILLIDDDRDSLQATRDAVSDEGHQVEIAESGLEALRRFGSGSRYDIVLCDVDMPEMDGWHVAREIQRLAPGTPVYMLTGWEAPHRRADLDSVAGILMKPTRLHHLRHLFR